MKLYEKIYNFTFVILILLLSYLVCSSHEKHTTGGYVSKKQMYCSTPFYIIFIFTFIYCFIL